jgi:chemotaxis methyl-accepting protein methylase
MSSALEQVVGVIRRETGISLKPVQLPSLAAALLRVDPAMDAAAFLKASSDPQAGAGLLDRLIDEVTINETFLFRQRRELDAIDWRKLLEDARGAGFDSLRVWVAACASGEEAYTLAILASEAFAPHPPPVSILGTDISTATLERARRGGYGRRAVRLLDPELRERYFVPGPDGLVVGDALRGLVEFRRHNLVLDPSPARDGRAFDLIACRNVLIYFDPDGVGRVIESLECALAPHGVLVLGAADRLCGSARRLARLDAPAPDTRRRTVPPAAERTLRRPLGRDHARPDPQAPDTGIEAALNAANRGDLQLAVGVTDRLVHENPLDADAQFVRGLAELGLGDPEAAVGSLRRALYVDPTFGLAAFKLGRAHEELGDHSAAARAYEQALRTLEPEDARHELIVDQVDLGDVAAACEIRLKALRAGAGAALPRPTLAGGRK